MTRCLSALLVVLAAARASAQEARVIGPGDVLPPTGMAWHGAEPHVFVGGEAILDCASHGSFDSATVVPRRRGGTAQSHYGATFVGELVLAPPGGGRTVHPLEQPVRMVERIRLVSSRAGVRTYATELITFHLSGDGLPDGVVVRESFERPSTGRTTITELRDGGFEAHGFLDVWLEISLDGGRTWRLADAAARMTLGPVPPRRARPIDSTVGG